MEIFDQPTCLDPYSASFEESLHPRTTNLPRWRTTCFDARPLARNRGHCAVCIDARSWRRIGTAVTKGIEARLPWLTHTPFPPVLIPRSPGLHSSSDFS